MARIEGGEDFALMDVRSPDEHEQSRIGASPVRLLPVEELRSRLGEVPPPARKS